MKTMLPLVISVALLAGCSKAPSTGFLSAAAPSGEELCRRDLKTFVKFNDPDSVRINSVTSNTERPGRYMMSVSAKNAMGGYGDPVACTCGAPADKVTDLHCDTPG